MDNVNQNSNPLTIEVENHGSWFSVEFNSGRIMVYPTPIDVSQLSEIKASAKKVFQERLAELELYENDNDFVAICAANFMSLAHRILSFGQGREGYTLKITYDTANYPRLELYHDDRIDVLRNQYVLKETLTIGCTDNNGEWFIQHIKYDGDKKTCVHSLFDGDSPIVKDIRKFVNAYCALPA